MYGFLKIIDILYISDHKKYFNHNNLIHNNIARELKTFLLEFIYLQIFNMILLKKVSLIEHQVTNYFIKIIQIVISSIYYIVN